MSNEFAFSAGCPHYFTDCLIDLLMFLNVMFDKSDELKSEDFLLFNILSLKELKVGL